MLLGSSQLTLYVVLLIMCSCKTLWFLVGGTESLDIAAHLLTSLLHSLNRVIIRHSISWPCLPYFCSYFFMSVVIALFALLVLTLAVIALSLLLIQFSYYFDDSSWHIYILYERV